MDGSWTLLPSQSCSVFSRGSSRQIAGRLYGVFPLRFHIEAAIRLEIKRSAIRRFQIFIRFFRNFTFFLFGFWGFLIISQKNQSSLPCSFPASSLYFSVPPIPPGCWFVGFFSIYYLFFLAPSHFPFFIISSLWSSVSFFFFVLCHGCSPSCSPLGPWVSLS